MNITFEQAVEAIKTELLKEYPWHNHDQWNGDSVKGIKNAWPHLDHVAETAAVAIFRLEFPKISMIKSHAYNCLISVWGTHYDPQLGEKIHCTCIPTIKPVGKKGTI